MLFWGFRGDVLLATDQGHLWAFLFCKLWGLQGRAGSGAKWVPLMHNRCKVSGSWCVVLVSGSSLFLKAMAAEVVIIGAGAAGLYAAQKLRQHGIKDVVIVEAMSDIGPVLLLRGRLACIGATPGAVALAPCKSIRQVVEVWWTTGPGVASILNPCLVRDVQVKVQRALTPFCSFLVVV